MSRNDTNLPLYFVLWSGLTFHHQPRPSAWVVLPDLLYLQTLISALLLSKTKSNIGARKAKLGKDKWKKSIKMDREVQTQRTGIPSKQNQQKAEGGWADRLSVFNRLFYSSVLIVFPVTPGEQRPCEIQGTSRVFALYAVLGHQKMNAEGLWISFSPYYEHTDVKCLLYGYVARIIMFYWHYY